MIWKPLTLYNPTDKRVEWMVDGQTFYLEAKGKDVFDGFVAHHAIKEAHTGLVEYEPKNAEEVMASKVGYEKLPWRELIKLASKEGVFKTGMNKDKVLEELRKKDGQTN